MYSMYLSQAAFPYSFLGGSKALSLLEHVVCDVTLGVTCKIGVDWFCGSSNLDSKSVIDDRFIKHFPAGTFRCAHRAQNVMSVY